MYLYKAKVSRVVDGDTVHAIVDLGFNILTKINFRLAWIDTPELNSKDPVKREKAKIAKQRLIELVEGKDVYLKSVKKDKYGRWLGDFFLNENLGMSINQQMITEGLAVEYK